MDHILLQEAVAALQEMQNYLDGIEKSIDENTKVLSHIADALEAIVEKK